jgi:hypothetical protein
MAGRCPRWSIEFRADAAALLASAAESDKSLKPQQAVVKAFLGASTPHRGLLLYHGLGSGKTCAAAAASAGRRTVVLLPAALRANFSEEAKRCLGSATEFAADYVAYNGLRPADIDVDARRVKGVALDDAVIVVEEAHNLASEAAGDGEGTRRGRLLAEAVAAARRSKVIALSGTPAVNHPGEIGILLNMVAGAQRLVTVELSGVPYDTVALRLREDPRVLAVSQRLGGSVAVAAIAPEGFAAGAAAGAGAARHGPVLRRIASLPSAKEGAPAGIDAAEEIARAVSRQMILTAKASSVLPFPWGTEAFQSAYVSQGEAGPRPVAAPFVARATGLVSYYTTPEKQLRLDGFPRVVEGDWVRAPMSDLQYGRYLEARDYEVRAEASANANRRKGSDDDVSLFLAFSRAVCNFAFPSHLVRPYPRGRRLTYPADLEAAIRSLKPADLTEPSLSRCSPKMSAVIASLTAPGAKLPALVYSNFRSAEGVAVLSLALEANGFAPPGARPRERTYVVYDPGESGDTARQVFNSGGAAVMLISKSGSEGLNLIGVRQVHIMEPHWNDVRTKQAVGRAVRLGSHIHLPSPERDVTVYKYIATLPAGRSDPQVVRDKGLSSDEFVARQAATKARLRDAFYELLQAASIECSSGLAARGCRPAPPTGAGIGSMGATFDIMSPLDRVRPRPQAAAAGKR